VLKICFVAGVNVPVGSSGTFSYVVGSHHGNVIVLAGPAPGGYCTVAGTFDVGHATVTETAPTAYVVMSIASNATSRSVNLATKHFAGTLVSGVTEVTYSDQDVPRTTHLGYLEICKTIAGDATGAPSTFEFSVENKSYLVPVGGCSSAIEVVAGTVVVQELSRAGWTMSSCATAPLTANLLSCQPDTSTASVHVSTGSVANETILTITNSAVPPGATDIVSDQFGYCAILTTTGVDCWGLNSLGQLGDGTGANSANALPVVAVGGSGDLTGVTALTMNGEGYCALLSSGEVDCWGANNDGYLGSGALSYFSNTPVPVVNATNTGPLTGVVQLDSDAESTCALTATGSVYCWGYNGGDELGPNYVRTPGCAQYQCSDVPVLVTSGVARVSSSDGGTVDSESYCGLLTTSGVECWGGGFGVGPVTVTVASSGPLTGVTSIDDEGYLRYCAILSSTGVDCWNDTNGPVGVATPVAGVGGIGTLTGVVQIATGDGVAGETFPADSVCVLLSSGGVDCWGDNTYGELGVGATPSSSVDPVQVVGVGGSGLLSGATSIISTGQQMYCVTVGPSATVDCWGWTSMIEGSTNPYPSAVPFTIPSTTGSGSLSDVTALTPFSNQNECVLTIAKTIDCWGNQGENQLGSASTGSPPTQVIGIG
jgi:hypothetical protein